MSPSAPELGPVAVTGATGFIGRHLVRWLATSGRRVRALARRDPASAFWGGLDVELVLGDLADRQSLERLVGGASAIVHLAGRIKAPSPADYFAANFGGTRALATVLCRSNPTAHLVYVSSLAAREPALSAYAASKRAAEDWLQRYPGPCSILRPCAVYGPVDPETLVLFRLAMLRRPPLLGPPEARIALIHVEDLAAALGCFALGPPVEGAGAICDARPAGYSWSEIMCAAAAAAGCPARAPLQVPPQLLRAAAALGDIVSRFGRPVMLTSGKLRELLHPNWAVCPQERVAPPGWAPRFDLPQGFADAVRAYREGQLLPRVAAA